MQRFCPYEEVLGVARMPRVLFCMRQYLTVANFLTVSIPTAPPAPPRGIEIPFSRESAIQHTTSTIPSVGPHMFFYCMNTGYVAHCRATEQIENWKWGVGGESGVWDGGCGGFGSINRLGKQYGLDLWSCGPYSLKSMV